MNKTEKKMKKILISLLMFCIVFLIGCSEFTSCVTHCRSNEYMEKDFECEYTSSKYVKKYCGFNESFILSVKDLCYNECKPS